MLADTGFFERYRRLIRRVARSPDYHRYGPRRWSTITSSVVWRSRHWAMHSYCGSTCRGLIGVCRSSGSHVRAGLSQVPQRRSAQVRPLGFGRNVIRHDAAVGPERTKITTDMYVSEIACAARGGQVVGADAFWNGGDDLQLMFSVRTANSVHSGRSAMVRGDS
jgi:hypothetical protein